MKKILSAVLFAGLVLLAASCAKEGIGGKKTVEVGFSVQLPEFATKAFSDGLSANRLAYAVYEAPEADNPATEKLIDETGYRGVIDPAFSEIDLKQKVSFRLVAGKRYTVLFWADTKGAPYAFDPATCNLTIDTDAYVSNNESLDAFCRSYTFVVTGPITEDIMLYRPFAQVNFGTDDLAVAATAGLVPKATSVQYSELYSVLNVRTGEVSAPKTNVVCAKAAIPDAAQPFPVSPEIYKYQSMNYVLVGDKAIADVWFSVYDAVDAAAPVNTIKVSNLPVKANYRTNVYGSLLTTSVEFLVVIDPEFINGNGDPDHNVTYPQI